MSTIEISVCLELWHCHCHHKYVSVCLVLRQCRHSGIAVITISHNHNQHYQSLSSQSLPVVPGTAVEPTPTQPLSSSAAADPPSSRSPDSWPPNWGWSSTRTFPRRVFGWRRAGGRGACPSPAIREGSGLVSICVCMCVYVVVAKGRGDYPFPVRREGQSRGLVRGVYMCIYLYGCRAQCLSFSCKTMITTTSRTRWEKAYTYRCARVYMWLRMCHERMHQ